MGVLSGIVNFFSGGKIDEELKQFKNVGSETTRKESEYGEGQATLINLHINTINS
jgi:hypothetical protein